MEQTTFYVDVENLQEIAKQAIISAIEHWPADFPRPGIIKLYVKADQTELWKIWANYKIPSVEVNVKGVQHFTFSGSKNSADISLALDALADLLKGRTKHVAIMSDDSDYVSLFAAVKQEIGIRENNKVPFRWFMTDRSDTRSSMLGDFFPAEYVHTVVYSRSANIIDETGRDSAFDGGFSEDERIARAIIQNIPAGMFKSSDAKKIIARNFPNNHFAKADSATFGTQFSKVIWPILQRYGVQLPNQNKRPRRYEMTEEAKEKTREV